MNQVILLQMDNIWKFIIKKATGTEDDTDNMLKLSSGASEEDLIAVARELNVQLPEEMKAFYSIHNGQARLNGVRPFADNFILLDTNSIIEQWKFLNEEFDGDGLVLEVDSKIKPMLWNSKWIPIADNGGGDCVCIDTDPTKKGLYGQIIDFYHDWGERSVTAKSLSDFLENCINEESR